jgi:transcriptional regulator with XRE-family HTH domain
MGESLNALHRVGVKEEWTEFWRYRSALWESPQPRGRLFRKEVTMYYEIHENIVGTVRCSVIGGAYSIEDFIKRFCPALSQEEIGKMIESMTQRLGHIFFEHPQMALWDGESQGWSRGLAVSEENLLDVLSLVPGYEAKQICQRENARAESEARWFEFVEANSPGWEAEGKSYQERREVLGLKVQEVASEIGVSRTLVRNFEIGKPIKRAELVKKAYGLLLENITLNPARIEMIRAQKQKNKGTAEQRLLDSLDFSRLPTEAVEDDEFEDLSGMRRGIATVRRSHDMQADSRWPNDGAFEDVPF